MPSGQPWGAASLAGAAAGPADLLALGGSAAGTRGPASVGAGTDAPGPAKLAADPAQAVDPSASSSHEVFSTSLGLLSLGALVKLWAPRAGREQNQRARLRCRFY